MPIFLRLGGFNEPKLTYNGREMFSTRRNYMTEEKWMKRKLWGKKSVFAYRKLLDETPIK